MSKKDQIFTLALSIASLICFIVFVTLMIDTYGDDGFPKDKPNRYQAFTVDGDSINVSKKDGADLLKAIDKETHSLMVPLNARGDQLGKIQVDNETDNDGVMKTVVRGDVYAYKDTVIYVADYAFDNSYDYAVLKGTDAKRVKEIFN